MKQYLLLLTACLCSAVAMAGDTMSRPNATVVDPAGKLSAEQAKTLTDMAAGLLKTKGAHAYVLVVDSCPAGQNVIGFTKGIFKKWDLNLLGDGQNFVIIYARKERGIRIEASDKVIKIVTREYLQRVIAESMIPQLKQGKEYEALRRGLDMMIKKIENN